MPLANLAKNTMVFFCLPMLLILVSSFSTLEEAKKSNSNDDELCSIVNLTANVLIFECENNQTNSIPSDDFYTINFNFGKSSEEGDTYEFFINGSSQGFFTYENTHSVNTSTSDELVNISIIDINSSCVLEQAIGPLYPCSTDCEIFPSLMIQACYNNLTDFDNTDDIHEFTIQSQAINGSSSFDLVVNGSVISTNPYGALNDFSLPADNTIPSVLLVDSDNNQCNFVIEIEQLVPCSQDCGAQIKNLEYTCTDNDYEIDFQIEMFNGNPLGKKWLQIDELDPIEISDDSYSFNLPADDLEHTITITDFDAADCFIVETFGPLVSCVIEPCMLTATVNSIECDNNGTSNDSSDDIFFADLNVASVNGGIEWQDKDGNNYAYSNNISVGPFLISSGNITFELTDALDALCTNQIELKAPIACSICAETIDAGSDELISCKTPQIDLKGISSSSGEHSWTFNNQIISSSENVTVSEEGWYYYEVKFNDDCSALDSLYVESIMDEVPQAIIISNNGSNISCSISQIELSTIPAPNVVYTWESNVFTEIEALSVIIEGEDIVLLTATDTISGCSKDEIFKIEEMTKPPVFELEPYESITCETKEVELNIVNFDPELTSTFSWYNENNEIVSNDLNFMVTEAGMYIVEQIDIASDCMTLDSFYVLENETYPEFVTMEDEILPCNEDVTNLEIIITSSENALIEWKSESGTILEGNNTTNVEVQGAGIYIADVKDELTGCVASDTVLVTKMINDVNLDKAQVLDDSCGEGNGEISNIEISGGKSPYKVELNNELIDITNALNNLNSGNYQLNIEDANGCSFDTIINIISSGTIEAYTQTNIYITEGESDELLVETNLGLSEIKSIQWTPTSFLSCSDCLNPTATPESSIIYTVTLISEENCIASSEIEIILRESTKIYVPNTFSPNNDGINDYFNIFGKGIENIERLEVFNRWGEKIYSQENIEANNPTLGWNGNHKDQTLNSNIFAYFAQIKMKDGSVEIRKGDITLIK